MRKEEKEEKKTRRVAHIRRTTYPKSPPSFVHVVLRDTPCVSLDSGEWREFPTQRIPAQPFHHRLTIYSQLHYAIQLLHYFICDAV